MEYNDIYKDAVNEIIPSSDFIEKIKKEKKKKVVKFHKKKTALIILVACLTIGSTAFASRQKIVEFVGADEKTILIYGLDEVDTVSECEVEIGQIIDGANGQKEIVIGIAPDGRFITQLYEE